MLAPAIALQIANITAQLLLTGFPNSKATGEGIAAGQIIIGSSDSVLSQIRDIADRLSPGILDLVPAFQTGEPTFRSIRLFGDKVLPRIRDL